MTRFHLQRRVPVAMVMAVAMAVFLAAMATAGAARDDDRGWEKFVTPNFELYSNANSTESRQLLRELETFRHVVSRFLGLTNVQREPALVFLFNSDRSFVPFKPQYEGKPRAVSGFHVADPLGTALALTRQAHSETTMRVLFHEYTHLLTARQFRNVPVWAHEGVAEVFSTFEGKLDAYDIGVAVTNHVRFLQRSPPSPITSLLEVERESPDYNEQERAGKFYATSWLLAHRLIFGRRGFETNVMARYAGLCSVMTNQLDAFRLAFGNTPDELDDELKQYLKGGNYTLVRQTYPDLASARPGDRRLLAGELDYALGRLLQLTQQTNAARLRFEESIRRGPGDPRPRAALALQAWRDRDRNGVRELTAEALRLGSTDAFTHFLAAESRYQDLAAEGVEGAPREQGLAEGRRLLERAIELDPWLAAAHHLLGIYMLAQNPRAPGLAVPHVQQALRCDPQYLPARLTWASLLAAQGNYGAARQVILRLLAGPMPPDLRETALEISREIERRTGTARPLSGAPR